jgi:hypothetical protein
VRIEEREIEAKADPLGREVGSGKAVGSLHRQHVAAVARHLLLEAAKLRIEERELEAGGPN